MTPQKPSTDAAPLPADVADRIDEFIGLLLSHAQFTRGLMDFEICIKVPGDFRMGKLLPDTPDDSIKCCSTQNKLEYTREMLKEIDVIFGRVEKSVESICDCVDDVLLATKTLNEHISSNIRNSRFWLTEFRLVILKTVEYVKKDLSQVELEIMTLTTSEDVAKSNRRSREVTNYILMNLIPPLRKASATLKAVVCDESVDMENSEKTEETGDMMNTGNGAPSNIADSGAESTPHQTQILPKLGPHDREAWQLSIIQGITQENIAEHLNNQHGTRYAQGQVSRMIHRVKIHAEFNGLADKLPAPAIVRSMDPKTLEIGERTDRLDRHQRKSKN